MTLSSEILGGLLKKVHEVEIKGPLEFRANYKSAYTVRGLRVERSKQFNQHFNNSKKVVLPTMIVRVWQMLDIGPDLRRAETVFALFPEPEVRFIELGHARQVLAEHIHGGKRPFLNEQEGNVFLARDWQGASRLVRLSRIASGVWSLGAPDAAGGPMNIVYPPGTFVLSY